MKMLKHIANFCLVSLITVGLFMPGAIASETSETFEADVIYLKLAGLSHVPASTVEEVIGFGYIERSTSDSNPPAPDLPDSGQDQFCQARYEALPPHFGTLQFVDMVIDCPQNLQAITNYRIDYKQVIEIFHQIDCGSAFKAMSLQWSRDSIDKEPLWTLQTDADTAVTIGANSGAVTCLPLTQP
ncbi:MAG: hypothetical protein F6K30_23445 [Cyanothece sp. SIO2G6]|nr:hypothetical protein [Cyanothece sp. SIO2G6]